MADVMLLAVQAPVVMLPSDFESNYLMLLRWMHLLAGITWIGLLYFFNLVNVPAMKELDAASKPKVMQSYLLRALWWFRWGAVATVLAGILYWMNIGATDARNAGESAGMVFGSFFLIWIVAWAIQFLLITKVPAFNKGPVLAVAVAVLVIAASWIFVVLNSNQWESNRLLSIGVGGGMGLWMMLNVWGIIWRAQKRIINWNVAAAAEGGAPVPPEAATLARQAFLASRTNAWLSIPMLFFMAAASHYPMFTGGI